MLDYFEKIFAEYNENNTPFFVGITGLSSSGKSYIASKLVDFFVSKKISAIKLELDSYYLDIDHVKKHLNNNYDHPESIDKKLLEEHLNLLKLKKSIDKPIYDFSSGYRKGYEKFAPKEVIVIDGIFSFLPPTINYLDYKIFVEANEYVCYKRRLDRDLKIRKINLETINRRWKENVIYSYKKYILPTKKYANLIIVNN